MDISTQSPPWRLLGGYSSFVKLAALFMVAFVVFAASAPEIQAQEVDVVEEGEAAEEDEVVEFFFGLRSGTEWNNLGGEIAGYQTSSLGDRSFKNEYSGFSGSGGLVGNLYLEISIPRWNNIYFSFSPTWETNPSVSLSQNETAVWPAGEGALALYRQTAYGVGLRDCYRLNNICFGPEMGLEIRDTTLGGSYVEEGTEFDFEVREFYIAPHIGLHLMLENVVWASLRADINFPIGEGDDRNSSNETRLVFTGFSLSGIVGLKLTSSQVVNTVTRMFGFDD